MRWLQSIIDWLRGKRRHRPSERAHGNAHTAIARIRGATHPHLRDDGKRAYRYQPGERRFGSTWAIQSPWHGGAWIAGWYIRNKRECWTVTHPADDRIYDDDTEIHEVAHDIEANLGLVPPWHNEAWRRLFRNWYNIPSITVAADLSRDVLQLPGVEPGDQVEIDFVGGLHLALTAAEDRFA